MALTGAQKRLISWVAALALFGIAYRLINDIHLEQTSLLFIGLPAALAIFLTLLPRNENAIATALKGVTIAIAMSGALLGEGIVCILMAAPLFYLVALAIGVVTEVNKRRAGRSNLLSVAFLPMVVMSLEGVRDEWSFPRAERVTVERSVDRSAEEVLNALADPTDFDGPLPVFLRIGFPRPQWIRGSGLELGDRRVIRFAGGEGEPGNLTLEVAERTASMVRFRAIRDESKIAHWLDWKDSIVTFVPEVGGGTRVTWTLEYDRRLDPAWYFGPMERYAVGLAADVLIDRVTEPR